MCIYTLVWEKRLCYCWIVVTMLLFLPWIHCPQELSTWSFSCYMCSLIQMITGPCEHELWKSHQISTTGMEWTAFIKHQSNLSTTQSSLWNKSAFIWNADIAFTNCKSAHHELIHTQSHTSGMVLFFIIMLRNREANLTKNITSLVEVMQWFRKSV